MKIAIDLRGLNFTPRTGINSYTLHLLHKLVENAKKYDLELFGIGLRLEVLQKLSEEFDFINKIDHISLHSYLKISNFIHSKFLVLMDLIKVRFGPSVSSNKIVEFDFLILPQPRILPKNPKTKQIACFHDLYSILDKNSLSWMQRLLDNQTNYQFLVDTSTSVIVNSMSTGQDLVKFLKLDKAKLKLSYPASLEWENIVKHQDNLAGYITISGKYFVAISGIEYRKNWYSLILAHHSLNQNNADYNLKLVLAGACVDFRLYKYLRSLEKKMDIKNIIWVLNPAEQLKHELIQHSEFVAYPSYYEGFGFPILEAFKYSKAILTANTGSMPEIAKSGGLYINPFNLQDIARGITILATDLDFRTRLEQETKKLITEYSWDFFIRDFLSVIKS